MRLPLIQLSPLVLWCVRSLVEATWTYRACTHRFSPLYLAVPLYCCSRIAYLSYARYSGPEKGEGVRVAQKTMLVFTWKFVAQDFSQSLDVRLLCRHAARHGVHLPKSLKNQFNSGFGLPVVDALADSAIRRVREELGLSDMVKLDCRPLCVCRRALARAGMLACDGAVVHIRMRMYACAPFLLLP